jgi:hypothetical protein
MIDTTRIVGIHAVARRLFAHDKPAATRSMGKNR